ncbi:centromere-associated protein E [Dorcoceras hygrometricum]|uniref:Centromere-associated protein E n=1 Tax=Dorcoceras hygrometricum TaxID=472368 RepID=A0A2Z7CH85_9LAMI|nr:centromere-associated protein E [Dorcoceras hygrometricum]
MVKAVDTTAFCLRAKDSAGGWCDDENQQIATIILNQQSLSLKRNQQQRFSSDANSAATQLQQLTFSDADFVFSMEILDAKQVPKFCSSKGSRPLVTPSNPDQCKRSVNEINQSEQEDSNFSFEIPMVSIFCLWINLATSCFWKYPQTLGNGPSAPRTRAAAALRMKQISLDSQDRTIRRLRAQLATQRRGLAATKKELEETQVALEASHKVIVGLTEIGLSMSKKIERMKVKKQQVRANHVECHQKFQARIHEAEDSMQAQHMLIEALVDEKDSLLQTIHGLQEANNAPAPFDGDWEEEPEEEPEEEEIEDIPLGEGEIDDE